MKTIIFSLFVIMFIGISTSFGDTIQITGNPAVLTLEQGSSDVYVLPSNYVSTNGYYYVTYNSNEVCYPSKQPFNLNYSMIKVKGATGIIQWYCYEASPEYFVITP